jgi:CubicO group peptidase (beta-lactamase class C family)
LISFVLLASALSLQLTSVVQTQAAEATAWPTPEWQVASPETVGLSSAKLEKLRDWLRDHGSKTGLVIRHGRIAGEWYWQEATASTPYPVYSVSKSFSSTAAGLAIAEGKLTLDTKVGDLFPEVSPPEKRAITLRELLSMTSGVIKNDKFRDEPDQFAYALNSAPLADKPGAKWEYNNTGLAILSPVFAKATGQEIDEWLDAKVFQTIGIAKSDWSWERSAGHALPYSGLHINARALGRFGLLFLNRGKWQDRQVVPSDWVAAATHATQSLNKQYGYLWWANTDGAKWKGAPADAFAALGRFDNNMLILPGQDMVVIRQIGDAGTNPPKFDQTEWARMALETIAD